MDRYINKRLAFFDIETTAIPVEGVPHVDTIHCIGIKLNDEPTLMYTSRFLPLPNYGGTLRNALEVLNSADFIVGHNVIAFDCVVTENLLGKLTSPRLDTLLLSKIIYTKDELIDHDVSEQLPPSLYGSYSLEAFGLRLGHHKQDFHDWSRLTSQMCQYCTQDVEVTYHLFNTLCESELYPSQQIIDLENEVAELIAQQQYVGFHYDLQAGRELMTKLMHEQLTLELRLSKTFKPKLMPDGQPVTPAGARRNKIYIPNPSHQNLTAIAYHPHQYTTTKIGKVKHRGKTYYKWFTEPHRLIYQYTEGEYQKIKLTKFDPGSRHKIRHWLKTDFDFEFSTYTEKGTPKVEGEELASLGDYGVDLRRYLKIVKDLSQLRGLNEAVRADSTITSRIDTNGTVTGRFTSSSVNLNQIPAQEEFRKLFTAPEGWTFVGTDFSGQENVNLAEALFEFDGGRLNEINTNGDKDLGTDLHSINAKSCSVSRSDAKPLWFGFLYGSSSTLTGYTLLGSKDYTDFTQDEWDRAVSTIEKRLIKTDDGDFYYPVKSGQSAVYVKYTDQLVKQAIFGAQVQSRLIQSTNGLSDLIKKFEKEVESTGGITTLGGRFIPVSSSHKCLNYFCQGQGAESMKYYIRTIHRDFAEAGLIHGIHFKHQATIYDEIDLIVQNEYVPTVVTILTEAYTKISRQLNMKCTYGGEVMVGRTWYDCH